METWRVIFKFEKGFYIDLEDLSREITVWWKEGYDFGGFFQVPKTGWLCG